MSDYEIPLSPGFYKHDDDKVVIIDGKEVHIIDRRGEKPYDLVTITTTEIRELMQILTDHMSSHMMRPFGTLPEKYDEYEQ